MTDTDTPLDERKQFDKVLFTRSFTAKWTLTMYFLRIKNSARIYYFELLQNREMTKIEDCIQIYQPT